MKGPKILRFKVLAFISIVFLSSVPTVSHPNSSVSSLLEGCELSARHFAKPANHFANELTRILNEDPNANRTLLYKALRERFQTVGDQYFSIQKDTKRVAEQDLERENASTTKKTFTRLFFESLQISSEVSLKIAINQVIEATNESTSFSEQRFERTIQTECKRRVYTSQINPN